MQIYNSQLHRQRSNRAVNFFKNSELLFVWNFRKKHFALVEAKLSDTLNSKLAFEQDFNETRHLMWTVSRKFS